jgi:ABC-type Na+ efflux pump permease subunit
LVIRVKRPQDDRTRLREWPIEFEITYDPDSSPSKEALRFVQSRLVAANVSLHEEALHRAGADALIRPVRVRSKGLVHEARKRGFLLAVLVPLVLILMTMTGAVYPAIDLTAGERERGTLEMLMATPVSRVALLAAKYVAVVVVASLTALMNLLMMTLTFFLVGGWMNVGGGLGLSLDMIPVVLLLVVLFAAFYAAVLLVLSSFARSFKEAQAYVIPLTLVSLVPGLLALMPNLQLGYGLALVPLLNIVLLARDLLSGSGGIGLTLVIIVATVVYGYIALVLASRTFGAEAVLYADSRSWWNFLRGRM